MYIYIRIYTCSDDPPLPPQPAQRRGCCNIQFLAPSAPQRLAVFQTYSSPSATEEHCSGSCELRDSHTQGPREEINTPTHGDVHETYPWGYGESYETLRADRWGHGESYGTHCGADVWDHLRGARGWAGSHRPTEMTFRSRRHVWHAVLSGDGVWNDSDVATRLGCCCVWIYNYYIYPATPVLKESAGKRIWGLSNGVWDFCVVYVLVLTCQLSVYTVYSQRKGPVDEKSCCLR